MGIVNLSPEEPACSRRAPGRMERAPMDLNGGARKRNRNRQRHFALKTDIDPASRLFFCFGGRKDEPMNAPTRHARLLAWVDEISRMTQPDSVVWCDGSKAEYDGLFKKMVEGGIAAIQTVGGVTSLSWDAEKRRRTLIGIDAICVQSLMGRSGWRSPGRPHGKRLHAAPEACLDIDALAVRPARRTTRRFAPAAVRHPERPINLGRRSSASDMSFRPPATV